MPKKRGKKTKVKKKKSRKKNPYLKIEILVVTLTVLFSLLGFILISYDGNINNLITGFTEFSIYPEETVSSTEEFIVQPIEDLTTQEQESADFSIQPIENLSVQIDEEFMTEVVEELSLEDEIPVIIEFKEEPILSFIQKEKEKDIMQKEMKITTHTKKIEDIHTKTIKKLEEDFKVKKIKRQYKHLMNAIATTIKRKDWDKIEQLSDIKKVWKDEDLTILLDSKWTIPRINADDVWTKQNSTGQNITGEGIIVAIIDTGIAYDHPALGNCTSAEFLAGNCAKVEYGYDFYNDDNNPYDDNGHGTHCAGIVASENSTYKGAAPNATLIAYKVCSSRGKCPSSDIISAIENATLYGADVISISLGIRGTTTYADNVFQTSIDAAVASGTTVVISAGNNYNYFMVGSPGNTLSAITVGASSVACWGLCWDYVADFSSKGFSLYSNGSIAGIKPDIVAPGTNIESTVPTGSCSACDSSGYKSLSGTSMSTPMVAGVVALLKQAHPTWTVKQIKSAISNSATDVVEEPYEEDLNTNPNARGAGRVDAFKAYNLTSVVMDNILFMGKDSAMNISISTWNSTKELNLTNLANETLSYTINFSFNQTGINISLSNSSITLNENESTIFNLSITIHNTTSTGNYYGDIIVNSSNGQNLSIPFGVYVLLNPAGCPTDDTYINEDTVLSEESCIGHDFNENGIIIINASHITLDCNNTDLDGEDLIQWPIGWSLTPTSSGSKGIIGEDLQNITIKNCTLRNYIHGMYFDSLSESDITQNSITSNFRSGLTFFSPINNTISDNHIYTYNRIGIYFWSSFNNTIKNNEIESSLERGVWVHSSNSQNDTIVDNTINYNQCRYGIVLSGTNHILNNNNILGNKYGIWFYSVSNNIIKNSNITGDPNSCDPGKIADLIHTNSRDNYFINSSFPNKISFSDASSNMIRQWYLTVNVTDENNNSLQNANITTYENTTGSYVSDWSKLTDSNGLISLEPTTAYLQNTTDKYYAYPTNITGSKGLYTDNSTIINMSDNQQILLILNSGLDTKAPSTILSSPADQSITNLTNITFECNTTDDVQLENVSLYGNWTGTWHLNHTTSISGTTNSTQFDVNISINITSIWNCYACDNSSNCDFASSNWTFTINTSYKVPSEAPNVTIVSPTNDSFFNVQNVILNFTVTDDQDANLTCLYNLDGSMVSIGDIANGTYNATNLTSLSEASHEINVSCQDSYPQNGTSSTNMFYTDLTKPIMKEPNPADNDIVNGSITEIFDINVSDETSLNTSSGKFFWRYPIGSFFNEEEMTCTSSLCSYNLDMSNIPQKENLSFYFEVKDMAGNQGKNGTSSNPLIVTKNDTTPPRLTIVSPQNTTYSSSKIDFNISADEDLSYCKFSLDYWTTDYIMTQYNSTYFNYTNTTISDGTYLTKFWCNDTNSNINNTESVNFSIDTTITTSTAVGTGGGGGEGGITYECIKDEDCESDYSCYNHECVKLFDIKILNVDSPIQPEGFFSFTYYIKGMADFNGDVIVNFWLEKDDNKVTSGADTIYLGSFEEKTELAKLYLPSNADDGIYNFYVTVSYNAYTAKSYRIIEIKEGKVELKPVVKLKPVYYNQIYSKNILIMIIIITSFYFVIKKKEVKKYLKKFFKFT